MGKTTPTTPSDPMDVLWNMLKSLEPPLLFLWNKFNLVA
jgi:hypothetical protein